ncbi:GNAT family N-acetyltransferase [uncultured Roseibium sp.]|uniref:GNAT family N-acetyltransferase n=1 Tax=uncultured Roseibium sp. TaxID=1936171 RepID=UPI0032170824
MNAFPVLTGVPVLQTPRLVLRAPIVADFPAFLSYSTSERSRFVGGPKPRHAAFEKFSSMIGHWALRGFGRFVITDRTSGEALGHVGPLQRDDAVLPELTWTLWSEAAEGNGFAYEAAQAANSWFFDSSDCKEAMAEVQRENMRSHALAERLGGVVWTDGPKGWMDDGVVYRFRAEICGIVK